MGLIKGSSTRWNRQFIQLVQAAIRQHFAPQKSPPVYYKCRRCEHEEARGCLPTVSCGLYLLFLMGLTVGIGSIAVRVIRGDSPRQALDLGWWNLLAVPLGIVIGLVGAFVGAILLNYLFELIEYLAFALRKCPKCGARKWSWGYTRGFGL